MKELASHAEKFAVEPANRSHILSARAGQRCRGIADVLSYGGLVLLVLLFFFRTVFQGAPISKICRMAEWDSIYAAYATGKSALCDPSIIHLLIPHYFLVANIWKSGHLPLWNPYSACGAPLVGDIQATIFSPLRLLFNIFPTMYTYNLTMVLVVALAAVFTFAFCRQLGLSRSGSLLASIAYALCPYQLFYLELLSGQAYCLFPLACLLFVKAAQKRDVFSFVAAGLVSSLLIISGHPETSFFGIFFASLLMGLMLVSGATSRYGIEETLAKRLSIFLGGLVLAGIVAFCFAAPVILPFVEYLLNSDCYKYNVDISGYVPWQCVLYHLLQPGFYQASPYLGIVTAALWPLSLTLKGRNGLIARCLFGMALVAFVLMSRLGPMDFALKHPPFLWLVTVYCLPFYLLALSVMSAFSLDALLESESKNRFGFNKKILFVGLCLLMALAIPRGLDFAHVSLSAGDFDLILPHMSFDGANWVRDCVLGGLLIVALSLATRLKPSYKQIVPLMILILSFVGLASLGKRSLPVENKFAYPLVQPLPFLKEEGERMLSVGPHLLRSNTNSVYGISSFSDFNALFPKRYLQYAKAAGAKIEMFTEDFGSSISRLTDMASVKYILSQVPLQRDSQNNKGAFPAVKEDPNCKLYENSQALPGAYVVHDVKLAASGDDALKLIGDASFDSRKQVVLEAKPALLPSPADTDDSVVCKRPGTNEVDVQIRLGANGVLVLTDTYYPGWRAFVDGCEVPILRANYLFRGIAVPSGSHRVQFCYQPMSFWLGVILAVLAVLVLTLKALGGRRVRNVIG